ncbi:MAG: dephospho-CoA kinase [Caryophanon sp.]|nr:dephospho-CoA kinase [Caryophanon sp.]
MIIGLTGSIATGKSTVANMLREYGLPIVDADVIARQVVAPGTTTLAQIVEAFGPETLLEDGTMNRAYIGQQIFHEPDKRALLNGIIHPAIRAEMLAQRDAYVEAGQHVVMDIPLLFESKLMHYVENILVVAVSEDTQLARLMARNDLSEADARARIASQMPIREKIDGADAVLHNDGSLDETKAQLHAILEKWGVI